MFNMFWGPYFSLPVNWISMWIRQEVWGQHTRINIFHQFLISLHLKWLVAALLYIFFISLQSSFCTSSTFSPPCSIVYTLQSIATQTYAVITCTNCTLLCVITALSGHGEGCGENVKAIRTAHVSHGDRGGNSVWRQCSLCSCNKTQSVSNVKDINLSGLTSNCSWKLKLKQINKSILWGALRLHQQMHSGAAGKGELMVAGVTCKGLHEWQ